MKKLNLILLSAVLLGTSTVLKAQWTFQDPGFSSATVLTSISAADSSVVWIAGTDDNSPSTQHLIARSINGGASWINLSITGLTGYVPSGITAISKDTAWVSLYHSTSGGGRIYRTNDGGATWTHQTTASYNAPDGFPNVIHFFDKNNGITMGDPNGGYFEIYATANGGTNWQRVSQSSIPQSLAGEYGILDKFTFAGNGIWFPTNKGRLIRSLNKGATWQLSTIVHNLDTAYIHWVAAKSQTELLAGISTVAGYFISASSDGGITWSTKTFNGSIGLYQKAVYVKISATAGYYLSIADNDLWVSYDNGVSWTIQNTVGFNNQPSVGGLATAGYGHAWVSGRFINSSSTGLLKIVPTIHDLALGSIKLKSGNTICLDRDSIQFVLINAGNDKIMFDSTPVQINLNISERIYNGSYNQISVPPFYITSDELLPGQQKSYTYPASVNLHDYDFRINSELTLIGENSTLLYNNSSALFEFKGINKIEFNGSADHKTLFRNSTGILFCTGNFSSIQWQSRLVNATTWVNETGLNAQANNFLITALQGKYYRALLCGSKVTDSIRIDVVETGNIVGETYFDNQTNTSVANRINLTSTGQVSAIFTGSAINGNPAAPDRGMFYNFNNGSGWGPLPTARVESIRTGFGASAITKTNKEVVVAHNATTGKLVLQRRATAGTGNWTESIDFEKGMWPRIVCSLGDTIHVIALDTNIVNNAKLRYYRSPDAGLTWDIATDLPGYDVINGFSYTSAETYSITANNRVVAIVAGGYTNKLVLWKSFDNGQTWNTKTIKSFPANFDGNTIIPQTKTTDGSVSVILDNAGNAHVFTGDMTLVDDVIGDNTFNYFYQTDGILYWKETMPTDSLIVITSAADANEIYGGYFGTNLNITSTGLASFPSASINRNTGNLYLTFTAPVSNSEDVLGITRRDVFGIMSPDGGLTWSKAQNLTNSALKGIDNTFASTANGSNGKVHLLWEASAHTSVTLNDATVKKMILHDTINYTKFGSISPAYASSNNFCGNTDSLQVNYHSVGDFTHVILQLSDENSSFAAPVILATVSNKNNFDTIKVKLPAGMVTSNGYRIRLVSSTGNAVSPLLVPVFYSKQPTKPAISSNKALNFCNGDSVILSVDTNQIGLHNHFWFIDGVERFELYNQLKVSIKNTSYIQLVSGLNGCMIWSDTVYATKNNNEALAVQLTPDTIACEGAVITLKAIVTAGTPGTYQWKKGTVNVGSNSPNFVLGAINASNAGQYTVSINNLCGVYLSDTIDVVLNTPPVIATQPKDAYTCDGAHAGFKIKVNSLTPVSYQWKRGTTVIGTTDTLTIFNAAVTDTGIYTCSVSNVCGSVNSTDVRLGLSEAISINSSLSDTSLCQGNDLTLSVSVTGTQLNYEWYKDATMISSSPQLVLSNVTLADSGMYYVKVGNSCGTLASNTISVGVIAAATASVSKTGNTLIATITGTPTLKEWLLNDAVINGANDTFYNATANGTYKMRVTSGTCTSTSDGFDFTYTGIGQVEALNNLRVYPNPANAWLNIISDDNLKGFVDVYDALGRKAIASATFTKGTQLNISELNEGLYTVKISTVHGVSYFKITIAH